MCKVSSSLIISLWEETANLTIDVLFMHICVCVSLLIGPYFVIPTSVATPLNFIYRFPNKTRNSTAIYTNLLHVPDKKFREKRFNTAFQDHQISKQT